MQVTTVEQLNKNVEVLRRLQALIVFVNNKFTEYWAKNYPNLTVVPLTMTEGKKYYKLIHDHSVWAFVDKSNGDVYKPAGFNAPAKHVRCNIFDEDFSWGKSLGIYGPAYLRGEATPLRNLKHGGYHANSRSSETGSWFSGIRLAPTFQWWWLGLQDS